jgi:hypothetical protein
MAKAVHVKKSYAASAAYLKMVRGVSRAFESLHGVSRACVKRALWRAIRPGQHGPVIRFAPHS